MIPENVLTLSAALGLHSPKKKCPDCGGSGVSPDGDECQYCSGQGSTHH